MITRIDSLIKKLQDIVDEQPNAVIQFLGDDGYAPFITITKNPNPKNEEEALAGFSNLYTMEGLY